MQNAGAVLSQKQDDGVTLWHFLLGACSHMRGIVVALNLRCRVGVGSKAFQAVFARISYNRSLSRQA